MRNGAEDLARLPEEPINRLVDPIERFMHVEAAGGIVLLVCTVVALVLANSPLSDTYLRFWEMPVGFELGPLRMRHLLAHWINDGLMAVFFFVVGLEVKRELVLGELVVFSWVAIRVGLARLPDGVGWIALAGGGALAGIGFTMALFIAGLALEGASLEAAKVGILAGSAVAGVVGMALLAHALPALPDAAT